MLTTKLNELNCKVCERRFMQLRPMQNVCGPVCGGKVGKLARKAERVKTKERKEAIRTKPQLVALAQKAFNSFIRARDAGKLCISCPTPLPSEGIGGAFDCGHYRSVGSAVHMRFVEDNAHGQCKHCNRHLAGNHVAYRAGLLGRIGLRAVELIESDQTLRKYTREGLIEIARHYNAEAKRLKEAM